MSACRHQPGKHQPECNFGLRLGIQRLTIIAWRSTGVDPAAAPTSYVRRIPLPSETPVLFSFRWHPVCGGVECCFSKLKHFRRVATRFEKTAQNYLAVVTIAAIVLWIR